jgi:hypothetical protein
MSGLTKKHIRGDCELLRKGNKLCATKASFTMTRADGTTQLLCTTHANQIRRQMDKHPELYAPVRFVQTNPAAQLSKYS